MRGKRSSLEGRLSLPARRAQKEIVEFALLSLASFLILTLISVMFSEITAGVRDAEIKSSLSAASGDLAIALVRADTLSSQNPESNFTIYLSIPREIAGMPYEFSFTRTADDPACRIGSDPPSCIRALSGGKIQYYAVKIEKDVEGEIFGSSGERGAVTYNSNERGKLVLSMK